MDMDNTGIREKHGKNMTFIIKVEAEQQANRFIANMITRKKSKNEVQLIFTSIQPPYINFIYLLPRKQTIIKRRFCIQRQFQFLLLFLCRFFSKIPMLSHEAYYY